MTCRRLGDSATLTASRIARWTTDSWRVVPSPLAALGGSMVARRRKHLLLNREVVGKCGDFLLVQLVRVPFSVEEDEPLDPRYVGSSDG
jgi:hypothetical protein